MEEEFMLMSFPELYSQLATSPLYIIHLVMFILFLILVRNEKGCLVFMAKLYAVFVIVNYIIALYFRFFAS